MARIKAKGSAEIGRAIRAIQKRNAELVKAIAGGGPLTRNLFNACQIVEARAKEILTEKGHIVTGNLRRSINTQIVENKATRAVVEVGTWVEYAIFVETLPDGGFLFQASEETFEQVTKYMAKNHLEPAIQEWGR